MPEPHVVVLGAGPAGLGAAFRLRQHKRARVSVIEQNQYVGGLAASFEIGGQRVDFGSHRLHPACDPVVMRDIRQLLGDDLLDRPRHGRIRLRGRWIHFPLKPLDLLLHLDPPFAAASLLDRLRKAPYPNGRTDSFASVLWASLGPAICREFYFPYARKIWGVEPDVLSPIQARRRVSAASFGKLLRKVMSSVPGFRPPGAGRFYYPRHGYGQISEAFARAAVEAGAELKLGWRVEALNQPTEPAKAWRVTASSGGERVEIDADYVWSTVPVSILARLVRPAPPREVTAAASSIDYRAMILVYLTLPVDQFTEYDAHYFPSSDIAITRLSEPKNYAALTEPRGRTTLCAELPCSFEDERWKMDEAALGQLVSDSLARAGIPLPAKPVEVQARKLRFAYPIYRHGYEKHFEVLDDWAQNLPNLLSYGRQGLFAHDNTHHALFMAYSAVDCLQDGVFDLNKWGGYREVFSTHVVED